MKAYAIVMGMDEYNPLSFLGEPAVYLSMKNARAAALSLLEHYYNERFSQQFNINKEGNETVRYLDNDGCEICRIIGLEVM